MQFLFFRDSSNMTTLTTVTQSIQTLPTPNVGEEEFKKEKPENSEKDVWVFKDPQPLSIHSFL